MEYKTISLLPPKKSKKQRHGNILRNCLFKIFILKNCSCFTYSPLFIQNQEDQFYDWGFKSLKNTLPKEEKTQDYLITLTSGTTIEEYKKSFDKIKNYKQFKIKSIYGVIEFTKNDMPHLHIFAQSRAYIRLDRLKRIHKKTSIDVRRAFNKEGVDKYLIKDPKAIRLT